MPALLALAQAMTGFGTEPFISEIVAANDAITKVSLPALGLLEGGEVAADLVVRPEGQVELRPHPLECSDVGFFAEDELPTETVAPDQWADQAFAAIRGEPVTVNFDGPRDPVWRGQPNGGLDGFDPTVD